MSEFGTVDILNVGHGDLRLTFDKKNAVERERARDIVRDMLKRGFALLVQVGTRKGEPIYARAHAFDEERYEYIIMGGPEETITLSDEPKLKGKSRGRKSRATRVPAESAKVVAVGRSAGG